MPMTVLQHFSYVSLLLELESLGRFWSPKTRVGEPSRERSNSPWKMLSTGGLKSSGKRGSNSFPRVLTPGEGSAFYILNPSSFLPSFLPLTPPPHLLLIAPPESMRAHMRTMKPCESQTGLTGRQFSKEISSWLTSRRGHIRQNDDFCYGGRASRQNNTRQMDPCQKDPCQNDPLC